MNPLTVVLVVFLSLAFVAAVIVLSAVLLGGRARRFEEDMELWGEEEEGFFKDEG